MSFLDVFPFLNDFTFILFLVSCGFFVRIGMILMSEIAAGNKKRSIKCGASPANPSRIISPMALRRTRRKSTTGWWMKKRRMWCAGFSI